MSANPRISIHQGSIIALTNEAGQIAERITYDGHFGEIMEHTRHEITHNPYGYTGREMDTLRLYYYRARYYSPSLHRFLSPDPIEHASGDYNWYRYVGNDPVNFVDPDGLEGFWSDVAKGFMKGSKDAYDGLTSLPKAAWGYYNHLLNRTGYTDWVKGHKMKICKCQAELEEEAISYALREHTGDVIKAIWKDMKNRPVYYMSGAAVGPGLGNISKTVAGEATQFAENAAAATAASLPMKIDGGAINTMRPKINKLTGCY